MYCGTNSPGAVLAGSVYLEGRNTFLIDRIFPSNTPPTCATVCAATNRLSRLAGTMVVPGGDVADSGRADDGRDDAAGKRNGCGRKLLDRCDDRWPVAVADTAAVLLLVAVAWCLLDVNVADDLMAVPGGSVASVFELCAFGAAAGRAAAVVSGLPPLLGMMAAGIVLQNCGLYTVTVDWCVRLVAIMRCALLYTVIIYTTKVTGSFGCTPSPYAVAFSQRPLCRRRFISILFSA